MVEWKKSKFLTISSLQFQNTFQIKNRKEGEKARFSINKCGLSTNLLPNSISTKYSLFLCRLFSFIIHLGIF